MRAKRLIVTIFSLALIINANGQDSLKTTATDNVNQRHYARRYTSASPLVYEDVWDLEPYSFSNGDGKPDGFNIELIRLLMKKLNIPFVVKLKHTPQNFEDLLTGKADLTIGMKAFYHDKYGAYSNNVLSLFTHSVARSRDKEVVVRNFSDLRNHKVYVHENSFSHNLMKKEGMGNNTIPIKDVKSMLVKINNTGEGAVLWNSMNLRSIVSKNNLKNIRLTSINMAYGEYHFMSNDSVLLQKLDSVYEELTASEEILAIRQKWFYPEVRESEAGQWIWYVIQTLLAVVVFFIMYNVYYRYKERKTKKEYLRQTTQLELLLKSGNCRIWTYDVKKDLFKSVTIEGESHDEYNQRAFAVFYDQSDFEKLKSALSKVANGISDNESLTVRCHNPNDMTKTYYFDLNISVLHVEYGEPTLLLGVQTDKSAERSKFIRTRDNLLRFRTLFTTAMAQMAYYDKDGIMTDINDSACETFGIIDKEAFLRSRMHISQVPVFHHLHGDIGEELWVSSIVDFDELRRNGQLSEFWTRKGVVYYEFTIMPIYDVNGELVCYVSAGRDITEMAVQMNRERRRSKRIQTASEEIKRYTVNINTALEVSNTLLANYDLKTRTMELTYDMHKPKLRLSQLQCVHTVVAGQTRQAANIMLKMDGRKIGKYKVRFKTRILDKNRRNQYFELNAVPMRGADHVISHYFCLCRNVTELVETENKLMEETLKAQEAEKVKNSFLTNMSYEIRTPLNTVVGFAELFNAPHDREDEKTFIEEIKKNSDILLKLVNNILLLSRIDARMVELSPQPTDFGEFFKAQCLMGFSRGVNEGVKTNIETREEPMILEIDTAQTGRIIETLTLLSAQFTKRGFIDARYEYHNGLLTMCIKDSGMGMDKATVNRIMTRTYDGVKQNYNIELELTICCELAAIMGGKVEIESTIGKGTAVWVTIPCKDLLKELENNEANGII